MEEVIIFDKTFVPFIGQEEIQQCIRRLAERINSEYKGKSPLFIVVLNGAFIFAAELFKQINLHSRISFVKLASYQGTETANNVCELIGLAENIANEEIIIVEDIVDTGNTVVELVRTLEKQKPQSIKICTLLFKPDKYDRLLTIDYVGKIIPNDFVVGYGFDYNGYGRNFPCIYRLK